MDHIPSTLSSDRPFRIPLAVWLIARRHEAEPRGDDYFQRDCRRAEAY